MPIWLRLSGVVGRICMDSCRGTMRCLLKENEVVSYLLEKYVDNAKVVMEAMEPGTHWDRSRLTVSPVAVKEDISSGRKADHITMTAWGKMASSIVLGLMFTMDNCSKNTSGAVAMLDFQLWKEREEDLDSSGMFRESLRYTFFEKEMVNPKVLDAALSMPHRVKIALVTQEGVRCLTNISKELKNKDRCMVLTRFMKKLQITGQHLERSSHHIQKE